ncbi:MAG: FxsA family protein [Bdellovibrionaceae bacterium]|nr:FxsA family protein [Pseudobdellovibrionaceae bacterium]
MPIFLIWTIVEILIFSAFADHFGFLVTLLGYGLPTLLGLILLSQFRVQGLATLQANLSQGKEPTQQILRAASKGFGAILLLPPSFLLRVIGLLLVTPGVSNLLLFVLKVTLLKRLMRFGSGFVRTGTGGFAFYSRTQNSNGRWENFENFDHPQGGHDNRIRDVEAIDVTPLSIDHSEGPKKDSK